MMPRAPRSHQAQRVPAHPICAAMAAVGFRACAVRATYYGRADSKAAAMAWVDEVARISPSPHIRKHY